MARVSLRRDEPGGLTALEIAAGAAELGLVLTPQQAQLLARFADLLLRWNSVHNLTAISSAGAVLTHHLLDSLSILPPIAAIFDENLKTSPRILDVGAGGGLPGIPIAIARADWDVTLADKVEKKVAFLTQAKLELQLQNVSCVHGRVEQLASLPFNLIVSRAFSTLEEFVRVSRHLMVPAGWWAAMKGSVPTQELEQLSARFPDVRVVDVVRLHVPRLDAERHLVLLQCP